MGVNEKITIYNGNWDFGLTWITTVFAIAAAVGYSYDNTPFMVLFIIATCVALLMSFRESLMANDSALWAALAVPAKFILIVFIILCGCMALGGVRSGMDELKKGNRGKAAMQFSIATVAALGAQFFHRLIKKLIKERVCKRTLIGSKTQRLNNMTTLNSTVRSQIPEAVAQKVETMSVVNQAAFEEEFGRKRKNTGVAYVFWIIGGFLGIHYLYFGKALLFVLYIITLGGFGIWWIVDLFRISGMVRAHNKSVALNVLRDIQVLN